MSALRGFAARRESVGAGFDYLLPKWARKKTLRYFESQAERFLDIWVDEIALLVFNRSAPDERSEVTVADVDLAFSAVLNSMRRTHRPLVNYLARRVGHISYSAPNSCPDMVLLHFEREAQRFLNEWATDIEQMAFDFRDTDGEPTVSGPIIDRALRATFNRVLRRRDTAKAEDRPAPLPSRWRALGRLLPVWAGAVLAAVGGAGGAWALVQDQLQSAQQYTALPIAVAAVTIGLVIVVAGWGGKQPRL